MGIDTLRRADWLNGQRLRGYAVLLALLNMATLVWLLVTSHGGIDRNGFLLGTDFLSFWTTGRMVQTGAPVYDVAAHIAAQRQFFDHGEAFTAFFYPPPFLLWCWPLGSLGYFPALASWIGLTGGAYALVVRTWWQACGLGGRWWLALAAYPPVLITLTHGQTSFLVPALLGGGALLIPRRAVLGGFLIGLAVIKPQVAFMVPVVLLVTREWRAIAGAALGAGVSVALAILAFGPQVWAAWHAVLGPAQMAMSEGIVGFAKMQSVFTGARLLGAPTEAAYVLQIAGTLFAGAMLAWAGWGRRYDLGHSAAMLAGGLLATPFVLDYDFTLLAFALIWAAARENFPPWLKLTAALAFVMCAFARPIGLALGIPVVPPILLAFFVLLVREVRALSVRG